MTIALVALALLSALAIERSWVLARVRRELEQRVTERTALLDAARRDLQGFIDAAPAIICYWDGHLVNRVANRACAEWFGLDVSSIVGKPMRELVSPEIFDELRPHCEAALAGATRTFEHSSRGRTVDGPIRTFVAQYVPDPAEGANGFYLVAQDVTELRRGQNELAALQQDNAALLATLHEHALVSVTDARGVIVDVNEGFCRVSGYARDELVGQTHRRINSGFHDRTFWVEMWSTIASGRTWRGEVRNRAKDGSFHWVASLVQPFCDANGRVEKYVSIRTDITERKAIEERLRHLNERFEVAASAAGLGIWEYDVATDALAWDARMFAIYGRRPEDTTPMNYEVWRSALHPDDRERVGAERQAAIRNGTALDTECRIVRPDGTIRHIKLAARIVVDESGKVTRTTGVTLDITTQKETELELHAKSYLVNSMLTAASGFAIISVGLDFRFTMFNTGAERLLGYRSDEVVGISSPSILHDPDEVAARRAEMVERLGRPIEGKDVFNDPAVLGVPREWTFVRKDGSRVPVSLTVTPLHGPDGSISGYLGIAHDVSIQKQSEQTLRDAKRKAEQASQAKSQFLANVSHEIRTPMNAVIGLAYLLEGSALDVEQRRYVDRIQTASRGLLGLINDVLDVSKIEAGELRIEKVPFDLSTLVREQTELMRTEAERKGIAFHVDVAGDVPDRLEGDAMRLRQILTNLTSNAIKFTSAGAVHVDVRVVSQGGESVRLKVAVRDSGIGISADALSRLFTPFAQADASTTRRFGGSGLGLSIVKQLAAMMGGEIGVSSTEGVGSEFWVELPFAMLAARGAPKRSLPTGLATHLRGVRILVVDDSEINLEVAQRILEREGAEITLARDGRVATDVLAASPCGFDVVLLDVQMPVLDGYGAAREIRSRLGLTLPIIALTAGTMSSEHQLALEAGMDDFMSKPFVPRALVDCIRGHLELHRPVLASTPPPTQRALDEWPQIDGIDSVEVQTRLLGDVTLFRSLLAHMQTELAEATRWLVSADTLAPSDLARRLHKLKGTSATLGARSLSSAAAEAETACRAGLTEELERRVATLLERSELLARSIESAREPARPSGDLDELLALLDAYDVSALARLPAFTQSLENVFAANDLTALRARIASLQFEAAAASIRERTARAA